MRTPVSSNSSLSRLARTLFATALGLALLVVARAASAGYTHYWKWNRPPTAAELGPCLAEMEKLTEARRSLLSDIEGRIGAAAVFRGSAPFGDSGTLPYIAFNGIGDDAHETFAFPLAAFAGEPAFSFVKTQWKPYDEVAVACLIVAHDHFPPEVLEISSDGRWSEEWRRGAALYEEVLGRPAVNPLREEGLPAVPGMQLPLPPPDGEDPGSWRRNLVLSIVFLGGLAVVIVVATRK